MDEEISVQELNAQIAGLTRELVQESQLAATYRNQRDRLASSCGDLERRLERMESEVIRLKAMLFDYIEAIGGTLEDITDD